jgi:hypothetical protein
VAALRLVHAGQTHLPGGGSSGTPADPGLSLGSAIPWLDLLSFSLDLVRHLDFLPGVGKSVIAVQEKVMECDWGYKCRWLTETRKSRMNPTIVAGKKFSGICTQLRSLPPRAFVPWASTRETTETIYEL